MRIPVSTRTAGVGVAAVALSVQSVLASPVAAAASDGSRGGTPSGYGLLRAVGALGPHDVWAVGTTYPGLHGRPIAWHLSADGWQRISLPASLRHGTTGLFDVAAVASDDVWAVGRGNHATGFALVLHWDGSSWTTMDLRRSPVLARGCLYGVSAVSADDVWAVGAKTCRNRDHSVRTFALHWDGTSWTRVRSVNPGEGGMASLNGSTALAGDDAWAVGNYQRDEAQGAALAEHWDGTAWRATRVETAQLAPQLLSVSGASASDVWAVGSGQDPAQGYFESLVEHWDGTSWSETASADAPGTTLSGVDVVKPGEVWAVGSTIRDGFNTTHPFIERWNGRRWAVVDSPKPSDDSRLSAIDHTSADDVWAAGESDGSVLVEHWNGHRWIRSL